MELNSSANAILDNVALQLNSYDKMKHGFSGSIYFSHQKIGWFGPGSSSKQIRDGLSGDGNDYTKDFLLPKISGDSYRRTELKNANGEELTIRANPKEGIQGEIVDITIQREPTQLLSVQFIVPEFSRMTRILMKPILVTMYFEYKKGYPFPIRIHSRVQSRGIGRLRLDYKLEILFQCEQSVGA